MLQLLENLKNLISTLNISHFSLTLPLKTSSCIEIFAKYKLQSSVFTTFKTSKYSSVHTNRWRGGRALRGFANVQDLEGWFEGFPKILPDFPAKESISSNSKKYFCQLLKCLSVQTQSLLAIKEALIFFLPSHLPLFELFNQLFDLKCLINKYSGCL